MVQIVEAIYEDGVLRPTQPLEGVAEHSRVRVTVEIEPPQAHPLSDCIGILPDADAEEIGRIIEQEFERVNPDEWR